MITVAVLLLPVLSLLLFGLDRVEDRWVLRPSTARRARPHRRRRRWPARHVPASAAPRASDRR